MSKERKIRHNRPFSFRRSWKHWRFLMAAAVLTSCTPLVIPDDPYLPQNTWSPEEAKPETDTEAFVLQPTSEPYINKDLHPGLCARADTPEETELAFNMHAGFIRTWMPFETIPIEDSIDNVPVQIEAMRRAAELGMKPIFVFGATETVDLVIHLNKLDYILRNFPTAIIEVLNEWDNPEIEFWKDRNPDTAAQFAANTIRFMESKYPDRQVILGATVDPYKQRDMLVRLRDVHGIDVTKLIIAQHSYNDEYDLDSDTAATISVMDEFGIPHGHRAVTELGVKRPYQDRIVPLVRRTLYGPQYPNAANVCLHALYVSPTSGYEEGLFAMEPPIREDVGIFAQENIQR